MKAEIYLLGQFRASFKLIVTFRPCLLNMAMRCVPSTNEVEGVKRRQREVGVFPALRAFPLSVAQGSQRRVIGRRQRRQQYQRREQSGEIGEAENVMARRHQVFAPFFIDIVSPRPPTQMHAPAHASVQQAQDAGPDAGVTPQIQRHGRPFATERPPGPNQQGQSQKNQRRPRGGKAQPRQHIGIGRVT